MGHSIQVYFSYQSINAHKLFWGFGPRWQINIRDYSAILHHSQVVITGVNKHLRQIVELWDQLLKG